jgi:hypothetical protein
MKKAERQKILLRRERNLDQALSLLRERKKQIFLMTSLAY